MDVNGLDDMDNRILLTIIEKFKGGPVGLTTIATAVEAMRRSFNDLRINGTVVGALVGIAIHALLLLTV